MVNVWLASYVSDEDYDAQRDDGFFDGPADMAEPFAFVLSSRKKVSKVKAMAVDELRDLIEEGMDEKFKEGEWVLIKKEHNYERWRYDSEHSTIHLIARRKELL